MKTGKRLGLLALTLALLLTACTTEEPADTNPALAKVIIGGRDVNIPVDPYGAYIRVNGEFSAQAGLQDLIYIAGMLYDLDGTEYAFDEDYFNQQVALQMLDILSDESYTLRLDLTAEAMGISQDTILEVLKFDYVGQYLSNNLFDKMMAEAEDDLFNYEAYNDYFDKLDERVRPTDSPATYIIDGEVYNLDNAAIYYPDYCRYLYQIETLEMLIEITVFNAYMRENGATFDETAFEDEADEIIDSIYEDESFREELEEVYAATGISREAFDTGYRAMLKLQSEYYQSSETFNDLYSGLSDAERQSMDSGTYYTTIVNQLKEGCEIYSITGLAA